MTVDFSDAGNRQDIMTAEYDTKIASHMEQNKVIKIVRRNFFWSGMETQIEDCVHSCEYCQRNKASRHARYGLFSLLELLYSACVIKREQKLRKIQFQLPHKHQGTCQHLQRGGDEQPLRTIAKLVAKADDVKRRHGTSDWEGKAKVRKGTWKC